MTADERRRFERLEEIADKTREAVNLVKNATDLSVLRLEGLMKRLEEAVERVETDVRPIRGNGSPSISVRVAALEQALNMSRQRGLEILRSRTAILVALIAGLIGFAGSIIQLFW